MFTEWTVVQLKRYLKEHHLPTSGKKNVLLHRCQSHTKRCKCKNLLLDLAPSADDPAHVDNSALSAKLPTISWTDSLRNWPQLNHGSISELKASDKHMKQGYNFFKCGKVETLLVGCQEEVYYCKGRVAPSMKKMRYLTALKIVGNKVLDSIIICLCFLFFRVRDSKSKETPEGN